jgi:hypothetical protein
VFEPPSHSHSISQPASSGSQIRKSQASSNTHPRRRVLTAGSKSSNNGVPAARVRPARRTGYFRRLVRQAELGAGFYFHSCSPDRILADLATGFARCPSAPPPGRGSGRRRENTLLFLDTIDPKIVTPRDTIGMGPFGPRLGSRKPRRSFDTTERKRRCWGFGGLTK